MCILVSTRRRLLQLLDIYCQLILFSSRPQQPLMPLQQPLPPSQHPLPPSQQSLPPPQAFLVVTAAAGNSFDPLKIMIDFNSLH